MVLGIVLEKSIINGSTTGHDNRHTYLVSAKQVELTCAGVGSGYTSKFCKYGLGSLIWKNKASSNDKS
jgi:hypothetical protein